MESFKGYLIDRDGVLIFAKDGIAVPGAADWMNRLGDAGIPYLVATNHTTSSPAQGADQLKNLGFPVTEAHMHTPLSILHHHFKTHPPGRTYVRGTPELKVFLQSHGAILSDDARVDTVIMGFDKTMDYVALSTVIEAINTYGARFIALHENRLFKSAAGGLEPGLGAWVRAVEYATGSKAMIVGKPSEHYYRMALDILKLAPENTVMISDEPLGDLTGARELGIYTIFVTSGIYPDRAILKQLSPSMQPDMIVGSVADLGSLIPG